MGLQLRAVGESPATADAAGIDIARYKYIATCVGSMIAGLGGLYYVMDYACGVWSNDAFGDRGWLAIALVIFAHKYYACGVVVNTINANRSLTAHHSIESNVLVGVCQHSPV